ncbi:2Fe-2S iron-sulfur cluster-binding protein [Streptomyces thermocarboxydus]|uniref:2Fe-2S iron-sulfur cluster-binding protein n=1 Tax=Streptomyces thermocarboxydus TaxID=59299 RepID=UPI0025CA1236|nr:2Fe-2S iron-sulfur cluster-binding protein [Streptomyces thermocarboxydus]
MTDDQHGQGGTPPGGSRWDPLPQGDYDDGATAFVNLPEGGIDALLDAMESPLAAPGHGYVPPQITVTPATTAGTDPAATGSWATPGAPVDGAQWHDPGAAEGDAAAGDPYGYDPGASGQWAYDPNAQAQQQHPQGRQHAQGRQHPQGQHQGQHQGHGQAPGQDVTGQWSIPVAGGDLPDESGEFTTSSLVEQWGGTPPATLPGGAAAPWAESQSIGTPWGPGVPGVPQEHQQQGDPYGPQPGAYDGQGTQGGDHGPAQDAQDPSARQHGGPPAYPGAPGASPEQARPAEDASASHDAPQASQPLPAEEHPEQQWQSEEPAEERPEQQWQSEEPAEERPEQQWQSEEPAEERPEQQWQSEEPAEEHPEQQWQSEEPAEGDAGADGAHDHPQAPQSPQEAEEPASEADGDPGHPEDAQEAAEAPEGPSEALEGAAEPSADGETPDAEGPDAPEASDEEDTPAPDVLVAHHDDHPLASYVLRVNGTDRPVSDAWIGESLLYVLRERLGLAGAKDGCSQGECGACNVQVDGRLVASCLVPAVTAAGSEVRTVEGLAQDGRPSDVQRALARCGAVQCGFCVPGMAMTVHDLLEGNPAPTDLETRQALCGNLCRCSGYRGVVNAVQEVVAEREAHAEAEAAADDDGTPRIPHQAGPGAGGVNPSAFGVALQDQPYGQDGGQA